MDQAYAFVSYVHEDSEAVDRFCADIRQLGVAVWRDKDNLWPGDRWKDEIRGAIGRGAFFVACFSTHVGARERSYMYEELLLAVDELRQHPPDRRWFIPVRLEPCEIPDIALGAGQTLNGLQRIDLFPNWNAAVAAIVEAMRSPRHHARPVDSRRLAIQVAALESQLRAAKARDRESAAAQLGELAAQSPQASAALTAALLAEDDDDVLAAVSRALASAGEGVVDRMCELLRTFVGDLRNERYARATPVLAEIGPAAAGAVPLLADLVRLDPEGDAGSAAAAALASIRRAAVPALLELANSECEATREEAFEALSSIGRDAPEAIPLFIDVLEAEVQIPRNPRLRSIAAGGLVEAGAPPETAVPVLVSALPRQPDWAAAWITRAIGRYGPGAAAAIPILEEELLNAEHHTRGEGYPYNPAEDAAKVLGTIGERAVESLTRGLASDQPRVPELCARALGVIGPAARDAVPQLCKLDGSEALIALGQIGVASPAVLERLRDALSVEIGWRRDPTRAALTAAVELGETASALLPSVLEHLGSDDPTWRELAMRSTTSVGSPALRPLIDTIEAACERGHGGHRCWNAVNCLAMLSASHVTARPKIEELVMHPESEVRASVIRGLEAASADRELHPWSLEILRRLADDEDGDVYRPAREALWKLDAAP